MRAFCRSALLPLVAVAVALTLPAAGPAGAEEPTPDPMAGAPALGDCSTMTWKQAYRKSAPEGSTTPCDTRHTTQVVHVGQLPDDVSWDDEDAAFAAISAACAPAFTAITGEDLLLLRRSLYTSWSFIPTQAQRDAGARWFRCDLALGSGPRLLVRKVDTLPVIDDEVPAAVGRCVDRRNRYEPCDTDPAWKHTGAFRARNISNRNEQRAAKQLEAAAHDRCPGLTRGKRWLWSVHAGGRRAERIIVCYSPTR